ncbi:cobalt-precorrin-6A reductase [Sulfitobacter aestuarii]|uniref:Cobalt-precorrin-6A reductase n=1 Tax=Sulfitobacter aestuarii TaxID=2161676 RepID=A0ABW5U6J7_9RHOB
MRILLLGGTTEASAMARRLAAAGTDAVFSYAGRTNAPVAQPLPTRIGGFGGVAGLCDYLRSEAISHVIDATHPFAAGMSRNAYAACAATGTGLVRLERPAWVAQAGDDWISVAEMSALPAALPDIASRVFLAIGKQQIALFAAKPQHHYLLRLVDAPEAPLPLPDADVVLARGPFSEAGDLALLEKHRITHVVAKNAGGSGARAKLDAARALGLPVIMAERPALPGGNVAGDPDAVMRWLAHPALRGV